MSNLVDNTKKRTSIKIYAFTYNTVTLRHFSIFLDNFFSNYAVQPLRLIVRPGLDVPTFATRRIHACHHARAPSEGRWNCKRGMFDNFA